MSNFCIKSGEKILFIGDSITDCGRREAANSLGNGYVYLFTQLVMAGYPEKKITYINKGIGGNRITDLKERWTDDVLVNKPDWLSIAIGINDLHSYLREPPTGVSPKLFRETYDFLLSKTKKVLGIPVVLIEPFYISLDNSGDTFRTKVLKLLPEYIKVVEDMSKIYKTRILRTHIIFQGHLKYRDADTFCPEPVHPNPTGHLIIAEGLLKVLSE